MNPSSIKMESNHTGMWVNFFTMSGIPSDVAATYALTFTENRIQTDMLLDLNKEYLRDMGITRMGDVIAILRHAKQVHESTARDRVLSSAVSIKVPVAAVTGRSTASPSSPASRILEHYTRNPQVQDSPTAAIKRKLNDNMGSHDRLDADTNLKKARLIRFTSPPKSSIKEVTSNKAVFTSNKTVFSRLGNTETVNSVPTKEPVKPIYARLGSKPDKVGTIPDKPGFIVAKPSFIVDKSVFKPDTSGSKAEGLAIPIDKNALKYEGILKSTAVMKKVVTVTTSKNNVRKIAMGCTMRADETPMSVKEKLSIPKAKSVKFSSQVQYKEIEPTLKPKPAQKFTPVFNKPERRLSMPEKDGVKARLGEKNANNLTITKNVFNRLGV